MLKFMRIWFAALLYSVASLIAQDIEQQQIWMSADGRAMTASVLEIDANFNTVKMKRDDGLTFTIGFDQLAEKDAARLREAASKQTKEIEPPTQAEPEVIELPKRFTLDDVPMVKQIGNFCVPASATMIAGYHGIETDQNQIAFLSSSASFNNQGTNPQDMLMAMEKLGFNGKAYYWSKPQDFQKQILPLIRNTLFKVGPIYISFRSGVFGDSGHGCVIIGYHDRKEELIFHNPWGNLFEKDYEDVATQARGIVIIEAPKPAPIASEAFIQDFKKLIPVFDGNLLIITNTLKRAGQEHELVWCSRKDARDDKKFAIDTARDDGRKILDLSFHRNPAVMLPSNKKDGTTEKYLFITRPPEGGAQFLVREITGDGWSEPKLVTLGSLTRRWPTRIEAGAPEKILWELPMIELHPDD